MRTCINDGAKNYKHLLNVCACGHTWNTVLHKLSRTWKHKSDL
jgi:hypothetical protein